MHECAVACKLDVCIASPLLLIRASLEQKKHDDTGLISPMELKSPSQYHFRQFLRTSFEDQLPRSLKMEMELHSIVRDFAHLFHVWKSDCAVGTFVLVRSHLRFVDHCLDTGYTSSEDG